MPSFAEIVGVIVTFIVLSVASGHGEVVWKSISELRRVALTNAREDWGCPSLTGRPACTNYNSAQYR